MCWGVYLGTCLCVQVYPYMSVCGSVYRCVCISVHELMCVCTDLRMCLYAYMCTCMCAPVCISLYASIFVYMCKCASLCICMHAYLYIYMYMCLGTHMVHVCARVSMCMFLLCMRQSVYKSGYVCAYLHMYTCMHVGTWAHMGTWAKSQWWQECLSVMAIQATGEEPPSGESECPERIRSGSVVNSSVD